jgi:hypothetical protein
VDFPVPAPADVTAPLPRVVPPPQDLAAPSPVVDPVPLELTGPMPLVALPSRSAGGLWRVA